MTKQLVEDIMQLELEAEQELESVRREHDKVVRKAQEKAMQLIQNAENTLDNERETALKRKTDELHALAVAAKTKDEELAAELAKTANPRISKAANKMLQRFSEKIHDDAA